VPFDLPTTRRFSRHLALPEIGGEGQERLCAATVALVGEDLAVETAALYLAGAGVRRLHLVSDAPARAASIAAAVGALDAQARVGQVPVPADGRGWLEVLGAVSAVVRSGFDDDALLKAAVRLGVPAVVVRGREDGVDLLAFRRQGPCPHVPLDLPRRRAAAAPQDGAAAVLAGTLAAAELCWILLDGAGRARAHHLRLPLDGGEPQGQDISWTPECFLCGGSAKEASFE
jgi:adenylyltransferase/sulfurtransferase